MQGLHHQQHQLAALLSVALPKDDSTSSAAISSSSSDDDSSRLSAVNSLHRAILYPPNSVLVAHSAAFLSQGLSTLLADKSFLVRQTAATAYGALCSVVCSISIGSNGRQNHVILGNLIDRFISWALPLVSNVSDGEGGKELALEALREFLNVSDVGALERYALPILKACQELIEDERTSLKILHQVLGVLTLISLKFFRCFQPHFVDIVDLLLGWALVPDLSDSDRCVFMDSFLQFQKHWVNNLNFSLGLLSKFLGDMDVLVQDGSPGTPQQFRRLLALLACFSTVLQSTASGMLETNLMEQIIEPLSIMLPQLLECFSMIGKKFGWLKWAGDLWRCLTLLAEIFSERFSTFYPHSATILFKCLEFDDISQSMEVEKITSLQVHGVLKTNLQLLSLQKLGLLPLSVQKILRFDAHISQLRLHPNHLVTGSSAATYIFLLQHENSEVVEQAVTSLTEELILLKHMVESFLGSAYDANSIIYLTSHSKQELFSLIKFDLTVLQSCVYLNAGSSLIVQSDIDVMYAKRSNRLIFFIIKKLNPFNFPIQSCVELQVNVVNTLDKLTAFEFLSSCSVIKQTSEIGYEDIIIDHLKKYSVLLVKALDISSPLPVILAALQWISRFCEGILAIYDSLSTELIICESYGYAAVIKDLVFSVLDSASNREPKVRSFVASVLEILLRARLIHPAYFYPICEVVLEKIGDTDDNIKNAYARLLSNILPITMYVCGLSDLERVSICRPGFLKLENRSYLHWKQVFALKQLRRKLGSQQLVSVLSYISQRWKVSLSSWVQRLIYNCRSSKEYVSAQIEESADFGTNGLKLERNVEEGLLEKIWSVNNMAGAFWAIHEAARYCISTRLRTNLGGPTQTFAALERMLLDITHLLQLDTEENDGNMNVLGTACAHLLPMRLLLDFVEALRKNVCNAYDGSIILPCVTPQSSLFFRANKKVCEEWFSRICEPMMNVGLSLHCQEATIHYCSLRLQELKNLVISAMKDKSRVQVGENFLSARTRYAGDILRVLRHMALSLCRDCQPESLIGLQKWVSLTFSSLLMEENQLSHTVTSGPFAWITGLIYQAGGQYEKSVAYFTHLLQNEESLSLMGSEGVQFAIARIIESYTAVSDWKSLESWLLELQTLRAKHAGKSYSGALTTAGNEIHAIHALARFDEGDVQAAWACLDLTPKSSNELTIDCKLALQRSEQMLLQAMLYHVEGKVDMVSHEIQKSKAMLEEATSILPLDGLLEAAPHATQFHCIFAFEEGYSNIVGSQEKLKPLQSVLRSYVPYFPIFSAYQDCSPWLKVLRVYRTLVPTCSVTMKLSINLLRLARKQRNLGLANRLHRFLIDNISNCTHLKDHYSLISGLQYEGALLMHSENKLENSIENLWSFVRPSIFGSTNTGYDATDSFLRAKAFLKLAGWFRQDISDVRVENMAFKIQEDFDMSAVSSTGLVVPLSDTSNCMPIKGLLVEEIVGTFTKFSSLVCPTMGKSWISYASWCYNQARDSLSTPHETVIQSCSFSPFLSSEVLPNRFKLTEEEKLNVETVILHLFHKENAKVSNDEREGWDHGLESAGHIRNENRVKDLVQQTVNILEAAAGAPGAENLSGECLSATLASRLLMSFLDANVGLEETDILPAMSELVEVWGLLRRRRVSLFGHAAYGFIQYLSYSSAELSRVQLVGSGSESLKLKKESYTLRATLYVLQILLNFGVELKDTLEPDLSTVPLLPWQEITPQLFARLSSHPEQTVRKQLEGLLMMLAKQSPWSIVYATLVDANAYEEGPSEELQHLLACLTNHYPRLIQDVQLVINELGNVTVLWEELWLSTLQELHTDVTRRIILLKEEAARIAENITLSHSEKNKINVAKYSAMMAPIVVALERRFASTSRKPETPHEIWFHETYGRQLKTAIFTFKAPPTSSAVLGDVWRPFDNIAASLATYQRKSSISLGEVAPRLALLSSSDVPMPGLEKQITVAESEKGYSCTLQGIVTISSFSEQVAILSTKTKPKKLVMLGSDGQRYTYLLKGREDLRLDARIMQLLQAINGFMYSSSTTSTHSLGIRYYSVTPISGRAGLIQWVGNVISIYSVFKSWQNRVQLAQLSALGGGISKDSVPSPVPRPSDMFYGKIIPALKEKGIRRVISRRDWPHDVKRKVLLDLMNETPKQLLHQELWLASEGFRAFSSKLKRYSGSVAAMSMVGHILGLGDRHLDNILIDMYSGDIVHIDYNVCFDKGQRLKIPEIVPFRLTQTLEATLGLTGVEGTFRANCEAVLGLLRKNKDVLLMLLEVFVWDPLVEWTRGDFHDDAAIGGEERKGMELAVSLSLFASRVQEIRVPLQEHHDLLLATLPAVESALERFSNVLNQYELVSDLFYRADEEMSNLILHETSAKSTVAEASNILENTRASYEIQAREFAQAKDVIAERAQEATTWLDQHGRILDALRSSLIPEINAPINLSSMEEALSLTSAVLVAGVPLTIVPEPTQAQCREVDTEVSQLLNDLDHGLSSAVTELQAYSLALQRILPLNYITSSPVHGWVQVLQLSANTLSTDILALARRQAAELIEKVRRDNLDSVKQIYDALCFNVEKYALEIKKVEGECAELENSIGSEAESKAKDQLLSAFKKYMQSTGLTRKEDFGSSVRSGQFKYDGTKNARIQGELEEKKEKVVLVLNIAASSLYNGIKHKVLEIFAGSNSIVGRNMNNRLEFDFGTVLCAFEEQVEKCALVAGFVNELHQVISLDIQGDNIDIDHSKQISGTNWASNILDGLLSCKSLIWKMTEDYLPDVIRCAISLNSTIMDAFGSISQVRGSIDMALEQLIEVEIERTSLNELEKNYYVKVGHITEQQLALEEAAMKGRDNLSWEEAEELASQEEACRAQLHQLHQKWNQKDMQTSFLNKREAGIRNSFLSSSCHFKSITTIDEENESHVLGSKALLSKLVKPFSELELIDRALSASVGSIASSSESVLKLADLIISGPTVSEDIWKVDGLLDGHSFFIWEVGVLDSFLDSCIHDVASYIDQNLGFDQLFNVVKKKLENQLQQHIVRYLKERVAPALLACLDKENEHLMQAREETNELVVDQVKKDVGAVRRVQLMLEEYCNSHETARAARSAVSVMKRQVNELRAALCKSIVEIVQMEWMHDVTLTFSHNNRDISQKFLSKIDSLHPIVLNLNRSKLLENIQSAVTKIARSVECLQACERISVTAEGQLERAMGWACGGPNLSASGSTAGRNSGIPHEFHDHLKIRRQLLRKVREKASDIIKVCKSMVEFEVSRDGLFQISEKNYQSRSSDGARIWEQTYINELSRLDVTYHSFTRTEQEWKLAESSMEAASKELISATNKLGVASLKTKSASGDLQNTVLGMIDCAYDAGVSLSSFSCIMREHTALTSECGSMLEEVLAITEGLHDVYNLGKEAASLHHALMEDLSKASTILLPLELLFSKDVVAMTDAMSKERETKAELSPIHGQAIYQSYCLRIRDACHTFNPLVPSLAFSVTGLHSLLTRLARTASLHAGNLHKAFEGLGESQEVRSQEINLSRPNFSGEEVPEYDRKERDSFSRPDNENTEDLPDDTELSLQDSGWISPPNSIYSSSSASDIASAEASLLSSLGDPSEALGQLSINPNEATNCLNPVPLGGMDLQETDALKLSNYQLNEKKKAVVLQNDEFRVRDEASSSDELKTEDKIKQTRFSITDTGHRVTRGKNPYAMSVLRRVEMKIEGRDIVDNREVGIAEQVDYLLRQATSVDNLCNMYEGWTPWI